MDILAVLFLRIFSRTPLCFNLWLGRSIGYLVWRFGKRERNVAMVNLEFCFPDSCREWQQETACQSIMSMGEAMLEAPRLWKLSALQLMQRLDNPEKLQEIIEIYQKQDGLVLATPHLGSWEYSGLIFAASLKMSAMFRPPKMKKLGEYVRKARQNGGGSVVPADGSGIKVLSRALAGGECIGILPDQEPVEGNGVFATFFGKQAYTMFLLPRLVKKRKPPAIFLFCERLPGGRFRLHYSHANDELYHSDVNIACASMNRSIENLIRQRFDQYNWNYKRFLAQPDGANIYQQRS